ncbi:MAG: prepilin-type N-terminal cleavage/methylation domain-containing protein [Betaproteobacteria bacterium]|nr:prepilin-type N-terminal cleavage/methylation domain-containing protein [Betaproteobacteria bacterium]
MNTLRSTRRADGFTLVELMIAILLGLIIVAVVLGFFLEILQGYRTNNAVSDVQTSSRLAFELLAHDIRDAGLTGCNNDGRVANILANGPTAVSGDAAWNADWGNALKGYSQGVVDDPALLAFSQAANTDSIQVLAAADTAMSVQLHTPGQFAINGDIGNLKDGDTVIVCDPDHAAILQIAAVGPPLVYNNTGNCGMSLDFPGSCGGDGGYTFGSNSQIAPLYAVDWYIGNNTVGGKSLYRIVPMIDPNPQEMVRDITSMSLLYLQSGVANFVAANAVTDWSAVSAVQITLAIQSSFRRVGTDAQPLIRNYSTVVALYNRMN